ncbi:hypothetical protein ACQWU4_10385 [Chryseobacterium sp. MIQD13]|uniref:hypothetical protein n=1 Tax=Chryseobacterium sp. MIQD13 TaxID=3422310 RepID=UPI003D2B2183
MKKTILIITSIMGSMLMAQTGNVGINTDMPQKTLDVNGDFRTQKTDSSTNVNYLMETNNSTMLPGFNLSIISDTNSGDGHYELANKNSYMNSIGEGSNVSSIGMSSSGAINIGANTGNINSSIGINSNGVGTIVQNPTTSTVTRFSILNTGTLGPFFSYSNNGTITGEYFLPRNYGKRGQILTTHGAPSDAGNGGQSNVLTWRDVADLIILKAPNGSCYKLTVNNLGILGTAADGDCAVDAYNPSSFAKTSSSPVLQEDNLLKMINEQNKTIEMLKSQMKQVQDRNKKTRK